ncbi:alpha/beta fold hydrolase [Mycobacterium sp. NPDC003449]
MNGVTFVEVEGRRARVRVEGEPDRTPILMLHGIARSLEDWEPQFTRYRDAGFRVIAVDLPGSGFSDRLPGKTALPGLAQGVVATLDAMGEVRPAHVVGSSLGGACALQILTMAPDRVASLILVGSAGFGAEVHPVLRMMATPIIGRLAARYPTRASARMIEETLYVDKSLVTDEAIDLALLLARVPGSGEVFHETARSLATIRGTRPEWRNKLLAGVLKHPRLTLIVWGDGDRVLPSTQMDVAHRIFPHAQAHLLEGVGHLPQLEAPDQFAQITLDFVRSQVAQAGIDGEK